MIMTSKDNISTLSRGDRMGSLGARREGDEFLGDAYVLTVAMSSCKFDRRKAYVRQPTVRKCEY